ncbi:MAG TPA: hypothetical protein VH592_09325 [Gemmataceae bacterium]
MIAILPCWIIGYVGVVDAFGRRRRANALPASPRRLAVAYKCVGHVMLVGGVFDYYPKASNRMRVNVQTARYEVTRAVPKGPRS